jgi:hypothetical protein
MAGRMQKIRVVSSARTPPFPSRREPRPDGRATRLARIARTPPATDRRPTQDEPVPIKATGASQQVSGCKHGASPGTLAESLSPTAKEPRCRRREPRLGLLQPDTIGHDVRRRTRRAWPRRRRPRRRYRSTPTPVISVSLPLRSTTGSPVAAPSPSVPRWRLYHSGSPWHSGGPESGDQQNHSRRAVLHLLRRQRGQDAERLNGFEPRWGGSHLPAGSEGARRPGRVELADEGIVMGPLGRWPA